MSNKVSPFQISVPPLLKAINNPPRQLFYKGVDFNDLLLKPRVAIVGARKATDYGNFATNLLARELAEQGVVIVSGLAFGVDAIAHSSAIKAGGQTIAVLPAGIEKVYPSSHLNLANDITNNGGIISELTSEASARKHHFINRNRIISGLSDLIVIVEASKNSGSLHTANFAKSQGKILCAVPGNINSNQSAGCNQLIKHGAIAITETQDIFDLLKIDTTNKQTKLQLDNTESLILECVRQSPKTTTELIEYTDMPASKCTSLLTILEIKGAITKDKIGKWFAN